LLSVSSAFRIAAGAVELHVDDGADDLGDLAGLSALFPSAPSSMQLLAGWRLPSGVSLP
jgi:hypothetical protein